MGDNCDNCVYIDGSCINNGKANAKAGYGVFFNHNDVRNEYGIVEGKQSNNTGELTALIRALEILKLDIEEKKIINIYTDSEYVIKCSGSYGAKLAKNNWKTENDKIPPNLKLLQKIYELYTPNKKTIKIHHIKAHTDLPDKHSMGNSEADRLANFAVSGSLDCNHRDISVNSEIEPILNVPVPVVYIKNYINISYEHKDSAKKLGAKWDLNKKKWYYEDNLKEDNISSIKELESSSVAEKIAAKDGGNSSERGNESEKGNEKVHIKIPFKNKDAVKKLGCRWDADKKSWYYLANIDKNKISDIMKLT
jgi:ribonuclease HI